MGVLRSRSRLVTFRLDPEEYASLQRVCVATGARSMSEFAREAVLASVEAGGGPSVTLGGDLVTLTSRLHELDKLLRPVGLIIHRVLHGHEEAPKERAAGGSA